MRRDYYNKLVPVNPGLAFTAPLPNTTPSPTETVDALMSMIGETNIAALLVRLASGIVESGDNYIPKMDVVPTGSLESMAKFSKLCKTPEEFAYLCYRLGQHDQVRYSDPSMISSMKAAKAMSHSDAEEMLEKFKAVRDQSL